MIDLVSAEAAILILRFVAFVGFLLLLGGLLSHSRWPSESPRRRATVAVGLTWGCLAYISGAVIFTRLLDLDGDFIPLSTAAASCVVAVVCAYAFWPWRIES